jgi:hypothetical protein
MGELDLFAHRDEQLAAVRAALGVTPPARPR